MDHPIVRLSNGVTVANFSSPHPFTFEDGTVLPACSEIVTDLGTLDQQEIIYARHEKFNDIHLRFALNENIVKALDDLHKEDIDIILVPFPVLEAIKESSYDLFTHFPKVRVIRVVDRVRKTISCDKFCV